MKNLLLSFRTCPLAITIVSLVSLALLLIKASVLNRIPAFFDLAPSLGLLLEGLLSATVAAYIFFIISVQLPLVIERRRFARFAVKRANKVANSVMGFLQLLYNSTKGGMLDQERVDFNQVNELFSLVSPDDKAPWMKGLRSPQLTWVEAMVYSDELRSLASNNLLLIGRFLDSEFIALTYEIDDSVHSARMEDIRENPLGIKRNYGQNLQHWAEEYYYCYCLARNLQEYCDKFKELYVE